MRRFKLPVFFTLLVICLFIIWARTAIVSPSPVPTETPAASTAPAEEESPRATEDTVSDSELLFTVLEDGRITEHSMSEYLPGVLAAEMPASFDPEALKAQAVAARTYIMYCMLGGSQKHPGADVCNDASCCKAYATEEQLRELWGDSYDEYSRKIRSAAVETDGRYLSYEGSPIQAVFHSSSYGRTEDGGALWSSLPYLVSVDSPETEEDVPNFITTVEVSAQDLAQTVMTAYPEAVFTGGPENWIGAVSDYESGRVASLELGGVPISGAELRTMFTLRSTAFTLEYTGESFLFTVRGYGHGVGMSQYGANVMAKDGCDYITILEHYYPGTTLS